MTLLRAIYFQVVLLIASGVLTAISVSAIARERSWLQNGLEIPASPQGYHLFQYGRCVGEIKSSVERLPDGQRLHLSSTFNQTAKTEVDTVIDFNDIGQLFSSELNLKAPQGSIRILTVGVNPIRFWMKVVILDKPFRMDVNVPGPILMERRGESYVFSYPSRKIFANARESDDLLNQFGIEFDVTGKKPCENLSDVHFPMEALGVLPTLQSLIKGGQDTPW